MAEKINEPNHDRVTSNKHLGAEPTRPGAWEVMPGTGRPDGPSDDGSSGGPTVGGDWGGMQADGAANTSADEMAVVADSGKRIVGEILHSAP
jgi:hypothetical protein